MKLQCAECFKQVTNKDGFPVPHLAGAFRYCIGGGFPQEAENAAQRDLAAMRRASAFAKAAWS